MVLVALLFVRRRTEMVSEPELRMMSHNKVNTKG